MNKKTTSLTRKLLAVAGALTLGMSASTAFAQGKGETLRVQDYPGGGNTLVRVAIANKYCEKYGIKCEVKQLANGPLGVQTFMAGELEVAYAGAEVLYQAVAKGADLKAVVNGFNAQPFFVAEGTGADFPNAAKPYPANMQDFKGKKVGVPARGSHGETLFTEMLMEAGMSASDVTYIAIGGPATAYPALVNKQVDALMIFSPVDGFCEVAKTCKVAIDMRKGEGPKSVRDSFGAGVAMWMKNDYIKAHPDAVKAFRMALADAETFVKNPANFDEVMKITLAAFKIPGEQGDAIVRATMKNNMAGFVTAIKPSAMQAVADYMFDNKQIPAKLNAASLILP